MKKEFIKRIVEIRKPTEYYDSIASCIVEQNELQRKIMYDWLNKTDAPKEVWEALNENYSVTVA